MLMPSMLTELAGIAFAGILLAVDWYVWGSRYQVRRTPRHKSTSLVRTGSRTPICETPVLVN
jgi:hypothetical protein